MDNNKYNKDLVSIIMPAYNAAQYIQASIDSVLSQTYSNWELIIINDGSSDCTEQIINENAEIDARVILISKTNGRQASARNAGIKVAKGSWIAFLDADDLWEPFKIQTQLDFCEKNPNVDFIYSGGWIINYDNLTDQKDYEIRIGYFSGKQMYFIEYFGNCIPILSVMVKREVALNVGLQDETPIMSGCEDLDYWIRIARSGANFYGMAERLFYYRRHNTNVSSNLTKMIFAELSVLLKNYTTALISTKHFKNICALRIRSIVLAVIKEGKIDELKTLIGAIRQKAPGFYLNTVYSLLSLRENAYWLIVFLNNLHRLKFLIYKNGLLEKDIQKN